MSLRPPNRRRDRARRIPTPLTADKAAGTDVIRAQAERAGATITEAEASHVIIISQPQVVTDVILEALAAVGAAAAVV